MIYFMGLDIGTSSIKAVLFDEDGYTVTSKAIPCTLETSLDGRAELDPDEIFNNTLMAIKGCLKSKPVYNKLYGIGISCQMHSVMAIDSHGNPLTKVITWADTRAKESAITNRAELNRLYEITGCILKHPMYPFNKIRWLMKDKSIAQKVSKWITIKEYILYKLYGEFVVDYTLASCQGYFNINLLKWDRELLDFLSIKKEQLSEVVPCIHMMGKMNKHYAKQMGLDPGIPIVVGSGDGVMANLGCGVFDKKGMSSTVGTSGALRTTIKRPKTDPEGRTWCYAFTEDSWVMGGAINNGGLAMNWIKDTFSEQFRKDTGPYGGDVFNVFNEFSGEVPVGSDGLLFLPYLTGERSPDWRSDVRSLMIGLDYSHTRKHIVRAAMEGVMYRLYSVYEAFSDQNIMPDYIYASGGYVQSPNWLQIQADVFGKTIYVTQVDEASALGAAFLAMYATGFERSMTKPLRSMTPVREIIPNEENHQVYRRLYRRAMDIYDIIYPERVSKGALLSGFGLQ